MAVCIGILEDMLQRRTDRAQLPRVVGLQWFGQQRHQYRSRRVLALWFHGTRRAWSVLCFEPASGRAPRKLVVWGAVKDTFAALNERGALTACVHHRLPRLRV